MRRFVGIGHVFHHTVHDIELMELEHWLQLAIAFDEHVQDLERKRSHRSFGRRR